MITHWEMGTDLSALGQDGNTLHVLSWCCREPYDELSSTQVKCPGCGSNYVNEPYVSQSFELGSFTSAWEVEAWILAQWGEKIEVVLRMA